MKRLGYRGKHPDWICMVYSTGERGVVRVKANDGRIVDVHAKDTGGEMPQLRKSIEKYLPKRNPRKRAVKKAKPFVWSKGVTDAMDKRRRELIGISQAEMIAKHRKARKNPGGKKRKHVSALVEFEHRKQLTRDVGFVYVQIATKGLWHTITMSPRTDKNIAQAKATAKRLTKTTKHATRVILKK